MHAHGADVQKRGLNRARLVVMVACLPALILHILSLRPVLSEHVRRLAVLQ